jgi:hypothetical protein
MENIEKVIRLIMYLLGFFFFIGFFLYDLTKKKDFNEFNKEPLKNFSESGLRWIILIICFAISYYVIDFLLNWIFH